ncbi:MAG: type VI secretion system tube protein Hcp [Gammaproteobacteria bacterium]|nr:type VI secretion system tube protein Hcp [Gammaproteobacteria bacterium]
MSIFMNYDGIKGESSDQGHKDWIDIDSWEWGVERKITSATSTKGDRESTNAVITDLIVTKKMDSASNGLFLESCCGGGKTVKLHLTKTGSGSGSDVFMEYTLTNAVISDYSVGGNSADMNRPTESITISFVEMEARYTTYDQDGNSTSPDAVGFDTSTNTKK